MSNVENGYYAILLVEELAADGGHTWYAGHPELPGCHAVARTEEEAISGLDQSRAAWLQWATAHGIEVPRPRENPLVTVQYAIRPKSARAKEADTEVEFRETYEVASAGA